ncbi:MAG: Slp family lipoprotein [Planctomycetota bacterium]
MKKALLLFALCVLGGCTHPAPTRYQILSIEQFRQIKSNPKRHAGRLCAFGGRVINAEETQGQIVFQILVQNRIAAPGDDVAGEGPLSVVYSGEKTTVAEGHQVKVLGYMHRPSIGKDLFGTTVSALTMDAIAVYDHFTGYAFHVSSEEDLFNKWKTGEPLIPAEAKRTNRK